jgi:diguanylate cyclase (GGDEF)-like protein
MDQDKAIKLRRSIYRALWVDSVDISNSSVLQDLLQTHGLVVSLDDTTADGDLSSWQQQWGENDLYDRNIPITLDENETTMIGLPSQSELENYLLKGELSVVSGTHAVCAMKPRQRILVLDRDTDSIHMILSQMRKYQVDIAADSDELKEHIKTHGAPDMIMVDTAITSCGKADNWYQYFKIDVRKEEVPIILMSTDTDPKTEVEAFESGAVDYFVKPLHPLVLKVRLTLHMDKCNAEKILVHQAHYDSLTGIPNRRAFDVQFQSEWDRGIRSSSPLSLLMIDVDFFKPYNDNYGHTQGDDCLSAVARVLESCLRRPGDLLARYGGEEFVGLLPETDHQGAMHIAERCRSELNNCRIPHDYSEIAPYLTLSIGVATCHPKQGMDNQTLIEKADICLYDAKQYGRNRVRGHDIKKALLEKQS